MNPIRRRRLGGSTVPVPLQVGGLALWLKADAITGLSDGTGIASWPDSSGLGNNAVQATGGKQPLYKVNRLNGLPGVNFTSASSQCLQVPSITLTSWTVFIVQKLSGSAGVLVEQSATVNSNNGMVVYGSSGASLVQARGGGVNQDGSSFGANWAVDNVSRVMTASYAGTSATLLGYFNGVAQTLAVNTSANAGISSATAAFNIGSRNQSSFFITGDLFEVLVYTPLLSLTNQQAIESYLRRKWGTP